MKRKNHTLFHMVMTIIAVMTVVCVAVSLVLYLVPLYYLDIRLLKIPEKTGYSFDVCRRNYAILADYLSLWGAEKLVLPDFSLSASGIIHFYDVKVLLRAVQIIALLGCILVGIGWSSSKKKRSWTWMKATVIGLGGLVVLLVSGIAIDAEAFFVAFHKIFFANEYWWFDIETDPIISILPGEVFLSAALEMMIYIGAAMIFLLSAYQKNQAKLRVRTGRTGKGTKKSGKK